MAMNVDETNVTLLSDANAISAGSALFQANCIACHNSKGEGNYNILKSDSTQKNESFELKLNAINLTDFRLFYTNKSN